MKFLFLVFIFFSVLTFSQDRPRKVENPFLRERVERGRPYYQSLNYHNQLAGLSETDGKFYALNERTPGQAREKYLKTKRDSIITQYVKSDISGKWDELDRELFFRRLNYSTQDKVLKDYKFLNPKLLAEIKKEIGHD